jgi:hypothetical protein
MVTSRLRCWQTPKNAYAASTINREGSRLWKGGNEFDAGLVSIDQQLALPQSGGLDPRWRPILEGSIDH